MRTFLGAGEIDVPVSGVDSLFPRQGDGVTSTPLIARAEENGQPGIAELPSDFNPTPLSVGPERPRVVLVAPLDR
jgi:hypothetical protein